jgi:hypothetical protein
MAGGIGPVVTPRADSSSAVKIQLGCALDDFVKSTGAQP